MEGFEVVFGLIIWVFAVIGAMHVGKKWLRTTATHIANDPEGFKTRMGLDSSHEVQAHGHHSTS